MNATITCLNTRRSVPSRLLADPGPDERIAGFIHLGTAQSPPPERERPDPRDLLTDWSPA